jgi:Caspase domain
MASDSTYLPKYAESWGLVVGIDRYQHESPLLHAGNDATAVAEMLVSRFGFRNENVTVLLNEAATRDAIRDAFLHYAESGEVGPDDRVLIFFAGHGQTVSGKQSETGYLVPADGLGGRLATLIRWDELTGSADLIPAKHILFLMDACYGGLALTRRPIRPGSMRFLKDMLQRYSRQVLTAGKADEPVADAGGSRPGHSIFTSYLLDGMEGGAATAEGILTGQSLMAYTYSKVSSDPRSQQTPHFGFLEGDGDFIFDISVLQELERQQKPSTDQEPDLDILIKLPAITVPGDNADNTTGEHLKKLLADPKDKIQLDDLVAGLLKDVGPKLAIRNFSTTDQLTDQEFVARLNSYELATADLQVAVILLARWATADQQQLLERIFIQIAELDKGQSGLNVWLRLNWYPVLILMYAAGVAATWSGRWEALRIAFETIVYTDLLRTGQTQLPVIVPTIFGITEIDDQFKRLPDMARRYVPRSEHLFKRIQPTLEDQLMLGRRYDETFDQFEILLALSFCNDRDTDPAEHCWGPPGRFLWKERGTFSDDRVYTRFVNAAKTQGESWPPLKAGLFNGSAKRFAELADAYRLTLGRISVI